ncbi:unnamed protein product [Aureobasidium vineae]|uniref:Uncharacterized protein n=1 Tax=Aureobasidium vineae TaxID=2773715 RepID=A0A9N8JJZ5_9PEZI|nr:unnamed protein product [Aureobasidium vineae]
MVAEKDHKGQEGRSWLRNKQNRNSQTDSEDSLKKRPAKWSLGILNDTETDEVPGESSDYPIALSTYCY